MPFLPITLDLTGRFCVIVGGGRVAARKVSDVLAAGATCRVVSPEVDPSIAERETGVEVVRAPFSPEVLDGADLVFVATDDEAVNRAASAAARERGVLVNVADRPELCDFHVPAVVRRGDLLLAISTGGKSPALAGRIRKQLTAQFGDEYAALLGLLGGLRDDLTPRPGLTQTDRKAIYDEILDSEVPSLLAQGRTGEAESLARRIIKVNLV